MCYVLLLSTTATEDLTVHNTELVQFSRALPQSAAVTELKYINKWYIGSQSGCSCAFRHLYSVGLGFGEPVGWYPEGPDAIAATVQVIRLVRALLAQGHHVDCIDVWEHQDLSPVPTDALNVDVSAIKDSEFRFFENHHFTFINAT
jgi:hypothetical protein